MAGSVHRTMKGTMVDMNRLINSNEMTIAVGNAKVNARGDKIGPGGKIIQKREEKTITENNQTAPKKNIADMDPEGNE